MTISEYQRSQKDKGASITSFFSIAKKKSPDSVEQTPLKVSIEQVDTGEDEVTNQSEILQKKTDLNLKLDYSAQSLSDYSRYSKETLQIIKSKITKLSSALKDVERNSDVGVDEVIKQDIENFRRLHQTKQVKPDY